MYIFHNAMRNITRYKGRSILIGIITGVIAVACCIALCIRQAAVTAKEDGLDDLAITAQISVDRQGMMERSQQSGEDMRQALSGAQDLSLEQLELYATAECVQRFTYTISSSLSAAGELEPFSTDSAAQQSGSGQGGDMPGGMGGRGQMGVQGDFTVSGYTDAGDISGYQQGTLTLTSGQLPDFSAGDNSCLISSELATLNGLAVGDTITLKNPSADSETYALTVTGIYQNSSSDSGQMGPMFSTASDPANQIITSFATLQQICTDSASRATTSTDVDTGITSTSALRSQTAGTYYFADVAHYEQFEEQARALGLPDDYTVQSSDISRFEQSLTPLENLSNFAGWFLLVVLAIGAVILVVFGIFTIRERKYEVGVLTAIGMKKSKVALQFVLEMFCVTVASFIIGTGIGAVASVPVGNALLSAQQSSASQSIQQPGDMGGRGADKNTAAASGDMPGGAPGGFGGMVQGTADYVDQVNASLDLQVLLQLLGLGIALSIVSSAVGVVFIMRYEPLQILADR